MRIQIIFFFTVFHFLSFTANADNLKSFKIGGLYSGQDLKETSLDEIISDIVPGTIIILGERHSSVDNQDGSTNYNEHQKKQLLFLNRLQAINPGNKINIGMEFINYTHNNTVKNYLADLIADQDFIKQIGWTAHFPSYKPLIKFSKASGGITIGINLPRSISSKLAKNKPLDSKEQKLLPPNFQEGRDEYRQRFYKLMGGGHLKPDQMASYFKAQSAWDDTMAFQTVKFMKNRSDEFFVIIVGDFHSKYGGGLPDRIAARGAGLILNISQVSVADMDDQALIEEIQKDQNGENRGDFIWLSK